jgi:hypothetical protein
MDIVEQNYKMYDEIKTLKKEKQRQSKAVKECADSFPEYDEKMHKLKIQIYEEKKKSQTLAEQEKVACFFNNLFIYNRILMSS